MNILVAVDLSAGSEKIIDAAAALAKPMNARVFVLHVAEPEPDFVGYGAGPEVVRTQVANELHREHREVQALADRLREQGINATALMISGPTVNTTLNESKKLGADMIVVGSHGHGAVYDVLIGSYSAGIIRGSELPVVVVPVREG